MKKTVLETVEVFVVAILVSTLMNVVSGVGMWGLAYEALDMAVLVAIVLLVDDVFFKFNRYRALLGHWEYWVGFILSVASIFGLSYAKNSESWSQFFGGVALMSLALAATILWDAKYYNIYTLNPDEFESEIWKRSIKKFLSKKMDEASIKEGVAKTLRFHLTDDSIEGGIDFARPFSEGNGYSLDEMKAHPEVGSVVINATEVVVNGYVAQILAKRAADSKKK